MGAETSGPTAWAICLENFAISAHRPFRWELINRAGFVVASGSSFGNGGSVLTNQGKVGQYWTVCWSSGPS